MERDICIQLLPAYMDVCVFVAWWKDSDIPSIILLEPWYMYVSVVATPTE